MGKTITIAVAIFTLISACQSTKPKNLFKEPPLASASTMCKDPRPEICTQEYIPVCATKDTGVRCVTTPCPSTEQVTYPNACTACADKKVYSHVPSACGK